MTTTIPSIAALPTPSPQTSDPANFSTRGDALLVALPPMVTEENLTIAAMNTVALEVAANAASADADAATAAAAAAVAASVSTYMCRITTSLSIGAGAKSLTGLPATLAAVSGHDWYLVDPTNPANRQHGALSAINLGLGTATLTVAAGGFAGSGTKTDWILEHGALVNLGQAAAADIWAVATALLAVTPATLAAAAVPQTLTAGTNIAWDAALGFNAKLTLAGAANNMSAPTNLSDGLTYTLFLTQDATGSRTVTAWNAVFDWGASGTPTLSAGAGKVDIAVGIYSATTGKLHMNFRKAA